MGTHPLPRQFYSREPALVARELIGKRLVHIVDGVTVICRIVETEAYRGPTDAASHAFHGPTARNTPMFGPPGRTYVYFIYGMHWMFNITAHPDDVPGAILIRAVEPLVGLELIRQRRGHPRRDVDLTNGPAKLAQALNITGDHNNLDLCTDTKLSVVDGTLLPDKSLAVGPRIRVPGGEEAQSRPWRFWIAGNPWVSK